MTASKSKPLIILPDYERIFRVIHGVLLNEKGDPLRACLYFGVIGAAILERYHRVKAEPVVGMAAYRLDGNVLVFASRDGNKLSATSDGFHCWVETNGMAIDFQAPLFKEVAAQQKTEIALPRKMLQKRLDQASPTPDALETSGTHWYAADHQLRSELLSNFTKMPANQDFIEICLQWYKPTPKRIQDAIQIGNQHGQIDNVPLSPIRINGAW